MSSKLLYEVSPSRNTYTDTEDILNIFLFIAFFNWPQQLQKQKKNNWEVINALAQGAKWFQNTLEPVLATVKAVLKFTLKWESPFFFFFFLGGGWNAVRNCQTDFVKQGSRVILQNHDRFPRVLAMRNMGLLQN